jgi:soluble cytochrome b562
MQSKLLPLLCIVAASASSAFAQSLECLAAYDSLSKLQEHEIARTKTIEDLLDSVSRQTEYCPESTDLWAYRYKLAKLAGRTDDADVAAQRGELESAITAIDIKAKQRPKFNPSSQVGIRRALIAGTSTFQNTIPGIPALEYADSDFELMKTVLEKKLGFTEVHSLTGSSFTKKGFEDALFGLRDNSQPNDIVVIYLMSHGVPIEGESSHISYVLAYDSNNENPKQRYLTAIRATDLVRRVFEDIPAERVVLILDTCYSGSAITGQRDFAGHPSPQILKAQTDGAGRVVIAASGESQRSIELADEQQGAFVFCFDQAVSGEGGPSRPIGELFASVGSCVSDKSKKMQTPVMFASDGSRAIVLGSLEIGK